MTVIRAFWSNPHQRRTVAWVVGALAALVLLYGGYTFLDAHRRYTELSEVVERLGPPTDPNDPSNLSFAMMMRDRDRAMLRRWQGVMFLGIGFVGLGLAYTIYPAGEARPTMDDAGDSADSAPPDRSSA